MKSEDFETILRMLRALAHESRLTLAAILAARECSVEELAAMLGLSAPTVSHHLARLREAGLVDMRAEGTTHLYFLDDPGLVALKKHLSGRGSLSRLIEGAELGSWEDHVLANFTSPSKLRELPGSARKRRVVLSWLAEKLDGRRTYQAGQLDQFLSRHVEHPLEVREAMVAEGILRLTKSQQYRRAD